MKITTEAEKDELRMNAPLPDGLTDYMGQVLVNKWNGITIKIIGKKVCDSGVVLWISEGERDFVHTITDLQNQWLEVDLEGDDSDAQ